MLVYADLDEIIKGKRGMLSGIDKCLKTQCLVSAVALIYSTIDALSALTRPINLPDTTQKYFIDWVREYMDPDNSLRCTASDLYGARCGVLHNYGSDSRKRREGEAKALIYKWRNGPDPDPKRKVPLSKDAITIIVEDLRDSLERGINNFYEAIERKPELKKIVDRHQKELLCYKPWRSIPIHTAA